MIAYWWPLIGLTMMLLALLAWIWSELMKWTQA